MPKLSLKGCGDVTQIASVLRKELSSNSGMSCNLVDEIQRTLGNSTIFVMVFEKYYARASNRVSLTVTVSSDGDIIFVDAIGSGGGQGAFFKYSWGAEEDFIDRVSEILRQYNFK